MATQSRATQSLISGCGHVMLSPTWNVACFYTKLKRISIIFPTWWIYKWIVAKTLQGSQRPAALPEHTLHSRNVLVASCSLCCGCLSCQTQWRHLGSIELNKTLQCEVSHTKDFTSPPQFFIYECIYFPNHYTIQPGWRCFHCCLGDKAATLMEWCCKLGFCSLFQIASCHVTCLCGVRTSWRGLVSLTSECLFVP